jgi:hypothetical protein
VATGHVFQKWGIPNPGSAMAESRGYGAIRPIKVSCNYLQFRSGVREFEKFAYVRSPNFQRFLAFREEVVPLIYGRDP